MRKFAPRLILLALLIGCFAARADAQQAMGQVPVPPIGVTQIGFTATTADQTIVSAAPQGVVWTWIWIYNYGPSDNTSNTTLWVTFGQTCSATGGVGGANGAIQIQPGNDKVFGGVRTQQGAQNVPQSSIHICTASGTAVGGIMYQ